MWIEESLLIGTFASKHQTLQTKQNHAISQGWAEGQDKDVSRTTSKVFFCFQFEPAPIKVKYLLS
jgi:hypothetical protein